ncbi:TetR/AcrR family transcriptional regulator [Saccharopolyspora sp. HNM0983]|uniref:TetR/AcrR family transcriptional regulator n=1 Tax=Saccharopolyspora montiporae TaxID=2781240 RepID=A0A929B891_9PSEU|nr:TetR/AcrR family transcriptional regulator [Saccharopolyspora sp. HNM0983]
MDADIEDITRALGVWSGVVSESEPKNKRGVRTRQHLLDSAAATFVRLGYVNCAVEDILQEADVSRGTFYSHFKSKKAIFAAVITCSLESRMKSTDVSDSEEPLVRGRVEESVRRFLDSYWRTRGLSQVIEQVANHDPSFREIRLIIRDSFAKRIAKGIRRQQARGIADPAVDPAEAGLALVSMLTNYAHTELGWRQRQPSEEMVELLTRFWVHGIGLDEDAPVQPDD